MKTERSVQSGTILLSTLAVCTVMACVASLLLSVTVLQTRVAEKRLLREQLYWLARGAVHQTLHTLKAGTAQNAARTHYPTGDVTVTLAYSGVWEIHATATNRNGSLGIRCTYNPRTDSVSEWQDTPTP